MKSPICRLPYINTIAENVLHIDSNKFDVVYRDFVSHPIIVGIGSGRTERATNIGCGQLPMMRNAKVYLNPSQSPFGKITDAMQHWEKIYPRKKILILLGSGSGETGYAVTAAKQIREYIEETGSKKYTVDAITSYPSSEIGMVGKEYGNVLEIEGGVKKGTVENESVSESGLMRDLFELEWLFVSSMMTKGVHQHSKPADVRISFKEELANVGRLTNYSLDHRFFSKAVDVLETRCHVFRNDYGVGGEVVYMTCIRLDHLKGLLGERTYFLNPPRPRAGDFQLTVSHGGDFKHVIDKARTYVKLGANQFSVIGGVGSDLEKVSTESLIFPEDTVKGQPRMFYMRVAFALSALPIKLVERLKSKGIDVPPKILQYYHSVAE